MVRMQLDVSIVFSAIIIHSVFLLPTMLSCCPRPGNPSIHTFRAYAIDVRVRRLPPTGLKRTPM